MHIKKLVVSGFKSYKDTLVVDDLSPRHNSIVGRNGSGKSNFFRAIQFVLGEKEYSNLSHKERQEMLHEGVGANVMTAFVEVVFDNSDGRFVAIDSDEVVLRRTIGLKKDEYFLNRKHATKADVINLLESAGFSRSNPYYVVKQGKIAALCTMKAKDRLELIKEVAGTTVYEERRKESLNIMADTQKKQEKIGEAITYIDSRLEELEEEKQELQDFRELDRRRKALEFALYDKELQQTGSELEQVEETRNDEVARIDELGQTLEETSDEIEAKESEVNQVDLALKMAENESQQAENERAEAVRERAKSELRVKDLEERVETEKEKVENATKELETLNGKIDETKKELEEQSNQVLEQKKQALSEAQAAVKSMERRRDELHAKQGRSSQFKSERERNNWIKQEITKVKRGLKDREDALKQAQDAVKKQEAHVASLTRTLEDLEEEVKARSENLADEENKAAEARKRRDTLVEQRKEVWRHAQELEQKQKAEKEELQRCRKALRATMPHTVAAGLESVKGIAEELGLQHKVHGPLYELLKPRASVYTTAIESAAQNHLLHVVVDDDDTASKLMEVLQARKLGRVTFKPLNQLRPKQPSRDVKEFFASQGLNEYGLSKQFGSSSSSSSSTSSSSSSSSSVTAAGTPGYGSEAPTPSPPTTQGSTNTQELFHTQRARSATSQEEQGEAEALPLISKIVFDEKYLPAVRVAFGDTLLCPAETAAEFSRKYHVNCVTLEGDEVNRRGALTGGFHDSRKSKIVANANLKHASQKLEALQKQYQEAQAEVSSVDKQVTDALAEMDKVSAKRAHLRSTVSSKTQEKRQIQKKLDKERESLDTEKENTLPHLESSVSELHEQVTTLENELQSPLHANLEENEREELQHISETADGLYEALDNAKKEYEDAKAEVNRLKTELESNLLRRQAELQSIIEDGNGEDDSSASQGAGSFASELEVAREELEAQERALERARQRQEDAARRIAEKRKESRTLQSALETLRERESHASEELQSAEEKVDSMLTRRSLLMQRREAATQKIRSLGSLSANEVEELKNLSTNQLLTKIRSNNERLKKYSHVNKKALDQFVNFSDQRETLLSRKDETDNAAKAIKSLIEHLDQRKDEAIMLTFKGVSKNFREVFSELVPHGRGQLNLEKASDAQFQESKKDRIDQYVGITPKVSFTSSGEVYSMQQLSGGQKALVALTLIFSIQRCDPAPFYLFDEIDQALDPNHRSAVANLIKKQARDSVKPAQFITTTFRPELVDVSDKVYGIEFQNKVSSINLLKKSDAITFIKKIIAEEEAKAPASSSSSSSSGLSSGARQLTPGTLTSASKRPQHHASTPKAGRGGATGDSRERSDSRTRLGTPASAKQASGKTSGSQSRSRSGSSVRGPEEEEEEEEGVAGTSSGDGDGDGDGDVTMEDEDGVDEEEEEGEEEEDANVTMEQEEEDTSEDDRSDENPADDNEGSENNNKGAQVQLQSKSKSKSKSTTAKAADAYSRPTSTRATERKRTRSQR